jgi:hypothetical protein
VCSARDIDGGLDLGGLARGKLADLEVEVARRLDDEAIVSSDSLSVDAERVGGPEIALHRVHGGLIGVVELGFGAVLLVIVVRQFVLVVALLHTHRMGEGSHIYLHQEGGSSGWSRSVPAQYRTRGRGYGRPNSRT